jgi:hypothetical protein
MVALRAESLPAASKLPPLPVGAALRELAGLGDGAVLEAALASTPKYVRDEVARLPQLNPDSAAGLDGRGEAWQRERLFSAIAEVLGAASREAPAGLVIEKCALGGQRDAGLRDLLDASQPPSCSNGGRDVPQ